MATIEKRENDNRTTYRVKVRLKGHPTQTASFKRLTDAKNWGNQTESAILEGRHFNKMESKKHTFNELADRYIKNILPLKPKSEIDQLRQINWWKNEIGSYLLSDVTSTLISEKKELLASGITVRRTKRSKSTVNRYLAILSHCFTIAKKEWGWVNENPVSNISRFKESSGVVRYLSDEERNSLLTECKASQTKSLYPIVILAISTGARSGEITNLEWNNISFERNVVTLFKTKNNEIRLLPLVGLAREVLLEWSHNSRKSEFVFPSSTSNLKPINIRRAWKNALLRANIEDFRFHDLRHSAASYLAMNGASLAEIAEVLGHKTLAMVKRYAHLSEAHTASVVERMNKKVFGDG